MLEYAGRRDSMVKGRGHRIELGEVENALAGHPAIGSVAVVVLDAGIDSRLHAVVVPRAAHEPPRLLALKAHCAQRLPHYMIIDSMALAERLPITANGKTDRAALAAAGIP